VFLRKSAEAIEKKRVEFRSFAEERKRVRKNRKTQGIVVVSSGQRRENCPPHSPYFS
jgi:hypothetical protein